MEPPLYSYQFDEQRSALQFPLDFQWNTLRDFTYYDGRTRVSLLTLATFIPAPEEMALRGLDEVVRLADRCPETGFRDVWICAPLHLVV